ncbi:MAG: hypothetical protein IKM28_07875 [Lachnospiraceae bacterium]|nr:hypothetical protein [Lachnospiraceae bacterium]
MGKQWKGIIQNMGYAVLSNGVILLSSTLISLLVPAFYSVADYGYLQLYLFYTSYLGLCHLGWADGIYLRLGGWEYSRMDEPMYKAQYRLFFPYVLLLCGTACAATYFLVEEGMRQTMFFGVSLCMVPYVLANYWNNILMATGRMKDYARNCFFNRALFLVIVGGMLIFGIYDLRGIMAADILGKTVGCISAWYACKNLSGRSSSVRFQEVTREIGTNISCGSKLLFANVSGMLILGLIRMGIEKKWSIEVYGQISLTLSVSGLLLGFISAVSQVMYTTARKLERGGLSEVYQVSRKTVTLVLLGFLAAYEPARRLLVWMLPEYEYGLKYMAILLPMCVIECKWSFLTMTYLKVIREEKNILKVNLLSVLLSAFSTLITVFLLENLFLTVCIVVLVLFCRGTFGEIILSGKLGCEVRKDILKELMLILLFITVSWNFTGWLCLLLYLAGYALYLLSEKTAVRGVVIKIRYMMER